MKGAHGLSLTISTLLLIVGCRTSPPSPETPRQSNVAATGVNTSSHPDGSILSLTPIHIPNTTNLSTYKIMYWSHGTQTEAFLAVPKETKDMRYPLYVTCHGGSPIPLNLTHTASPETQNALENAGPSSITLVPEYRGYEGSGGEVQGLSGDTLDTNNAIKAVMSRFPVKENHVYLLGASMGGGVVLQLAASRHDVRSVIAISPFVGWDVVGAWALQNRDKNTMAERFYDWMLTYGTQNPNSPLLANESVDYRRIKAPVLLLQGTGDKNVPWETVQVFYNELKHYNHEAKLIVFPGGQHGLHDKYQTQVNQAIGAWYELYGEFGSAYH